MKYFICVIGMVLVIEGLPYITYPDWTKACMLKLIALSNASLRSAGLAAVIIGMALIYLGTR